MDTEFQIVKIQRKFLYKRFIRSLKKNEKLMKKMTNYMTEYTNMFESKFDSFTKVLQDKTTIEQMNDVLIKMNRCKCKDSNIAFRINARQFLSAWMIYLFPEMILGKEKEKITNDYEYPNDIYNISSDLINRLNLINVYPNDIEYKRLLFKTFNQYSNAITYFLQRDKIEKINKLIDDYFATNETLREVYKSDKYETNDKKNIIETIRNTKKQILTHIQKLDKNIEKKHLEICSNVEYIKESKIREIYFRILEEDINERKFIFFNKMIEHIKRNFIALGYNENILNDFLDGEHIGRQIAYNNFSISNVIEYGMRMKNIINELESSNMVQHTNKKWEEIIGMNMELSKCFTTILFFIMDELDLIKENIDSLMTLINLDINPFEL